MSGHCVPQKPDLYRRAHNALLSEIETVIPIDTAKSIDELSCKLDEAGRADLQLLAARIKTAIVDNIGPFITCSIGFAANRQLDLLNNDDALRIKWGSANSAIDQLNTKYAGTVVSLGKWNPPKGGHVGGKISYTHIPSAEDFW